MLPRTFTLRQVREAYPNGVKIADIVWMAKRMFIGLGWVHRNNLIHASLSPEHILLHTDNHGATIIGWMQAVAAGEKGIAISTQYEDLYPPEVAAKKPLSPSTDIYMAAKCCMYLLGNDDGSLVTSLPPRLKGFFQLCMLESRAHRPNSAWDLHDDLGGIAQQLLGRRRFCTFFICKE